MTHGAPSSWYLAYQQTPLSLIPNATVVSMPAVQRMDVTLSGRHPVLLLIFPFVVPSTLTAKAPCNGLIVDIPILRNTTTAVNPGPAHFFLWNALVRPARSIPRPYMPIYT